VRRHDTCNARQDDDSHILTSPPRCLLDRMLKQCFEKCVEHYHDGELSLGENTCIDRCVQKYTETQQKVGEVMAKATATLQQQ